MFVKTACQALKIQFFACSNKQAFYSLFKQNISGAWQQESTFVETFLSVPGCQTCMYKRGIRSGLWKPLVINSRLKFKYGWWRHPLLPYPQYFLSGFRRFTKMTFVKKGGLFSPVPSVVPLLKSRLCLIPQIWFKYIFPATRKLSFKVTVFGIWQNTFFVKVKGSFKFCFSLSITFLMGFKTSYLFLWLVELALCRIAVVESTLQLVDLGSIPSSSQIKKT